MGLKVVMVQKSEHRDIHKHVDDRKWGEEVKPNRASYRDRNMERERERWVLTHAPTEQIRLSSPQSAAGSLSSKLFPLLLNQISAAEPAETWSHNMNN